MASRDAVDALHAELLGEVQELLAQVECLRKELPDVLSGLRQETDGIAGGIKASVDDFRAACVAMAEFIKARRAEALDDIERSTVKNAHAVRRALSRFRIALWTLGALGGLNLLITVAMWTASGSR